MTKRALYTGSFDPLTYGHLDIIERAAAICDELTVAVVYNLFKTPFFTLDERVEMIREATARFSNVKVDYFSGLLADYVNEKKFDMVVRGLRAVTDFEFEIQMAQINQDYYTGKTENVFLMTNPRYSYISSSGVKELVGAGADVSKYVPDCILRRIGEKISREEK